MREVVQIIRCNRCKDEVESEDQINPHGIVLDGQEYEFELCGACNDTVYVDSLENILHFSQLVKPKRRDSSSGGRNRSGFPYDVEKCKRPDGRYECPEVMEDKGICGNLSPSGRGLKMHWAREHKVKS